MIVYRIIENDPAVEWDVLSHAERGIRPRSANPEMLHRWRGISVFLDRQRAHWQAAGNPWRGDAFIAELDIPDSLLVEIEQTGRPGHYTLWADIEIRRAMLGYIVHLEPVDMKLARR